MVNNASRLLSSFWGSFRPGDARKNSPLSAFICSCPNQVYTRHTVPPPTPSFPSLEFLYSFLYIEPLLRVSEITVTHARITIVNQGCFGQNCTTESYFYFTEGGQTSPTSSISPWWITQIGYVIWRAVLLQPQGAGKSEHWDGKWA